MSAPQQQTFAMQCAAILACLKRGPATAAQLSEEAGVMNPAAHAAELARQGHHIEKGWSGMPDHARRVRTYALFTRPIHGAGTGGNPQH